jgi:hypothetical protein
MPLLATVIVFSHYPTGNPKHVLFLLSLAQVYFYSDDIDPSNGEIDDSIFKYDENDVVRKKKDIDKLSQEATDLQDATDKTDYYTACDDLLQEFHRNVENSGWEGGMVNQVCLAEGSTVFVKLQDIALKLSVTVAITVIDDIFKCSNSIFVERWSPIWYPKDGYPFPPGKLPDGLDPEARDDHGQLKNNKLPGFTFDTTTMPVLDSIAEYCANKNSCTADKLDGFFKHFSLGEEFWKELFAGIQSSFELVFGERP